MASVFDANDGEFLLTWLRTPDAAYLEGANRAVGAANPIVLAEGPHYGAAPSGAVTAGAVSCVGYSIPALPSIAWVMVAAAPMIRANAAAGKPDQIWVYPLGNPTSAENYSYPSLGSDDVVYNIAHNGVYAYFCQWSPNTHRSCWIPLDPIHTENGFQCVISMVAPAGAWAANVLRLSMYGCKYLGFPINAWDTGRLQTPYLTRGT